MKYLLAIAAGSAGLALTPAMAQPVQHAPMRAAPVQSRAQVVDHVRAMFARLDVNRDGFLTKAETQAARGMRGQRGQANAMRKRGPQARTAAFDRFDANRDGAISRSEWDAMTAQRQQRRAAMGGQRGGMRMAGMGLRGRMFDMADGDRDGRVTIAEAQNAALQHFDRADVNRDGQVTPEERRQMRQQMRAQHRG
jgi:Ca2+-binding EF-hand superfamily protein